MQGTCNGIALNLVSIFRKLILQVSFSRTILSVKSYFYFDEYFAVKAISLLFYFSSIKWARVNYDTFFTFSLVSHEINLNFLR